MSESRTPLDHLLRGVEELCLGAAEAVARARERLARAEAGEALERTLGVLGDALGSWLANAAALDEVRAALRAEAARWELRAGEDPAAERVHALVVAVLELLEPDDAPASAAGAPRRAAARGFRGRREAR
jgi:hypothetical protein